MFFKTVQSTLCLFCLLASVAFGAEPALVDFGRWSDAELAQMISAARRIESPGERIAALSGHFLDTPYVANTLIGDPHTAERLVIDLAGFDCFTFLDAVEALRRAADAADFPAQLQQVRYRDGQVAYENRRHFFSDWVAEEAAMIADVTAAVGGLRAQTVVKQLNLKSDGSRWMPGLPVLRREVTYLPAQAIDQDVLSALRAGDYVGIYSGLAGLDVSHTGLIVKRDGRVMLRHASSLASAMRVVDVDLLEYLQGKPGLLVYRVK